MEILGQRRRFLPRQPWRFDEASFVPSAKAADKFCPPFTKIVEEMASLDWGKHYGTR